LTIRRDPGTGIFFIADASTNGTWVNGRRLKKGIEDVLPNSAEIGVGEVLTLAFEART
jgi:predicted component of type VI protein secretion system